MEEAPSKSQKTRRKESRKSPQKLKEKQRIGAMWGPSPFEIPKNCDFKKCAPAAWAGFQIKFQIYAISFSLLCFFFLLYILRNKQFLFLFFLLFIWTTTTTTLLLG